MKKLFCVTICVCMLVGVFVGCSSDAVPQSEYNDLKIKYYNLQKEYDILAGKKNELDVWKESLNLNASNSSSEISEDFEESKEILASSEQSLPQSSKEETKKEVKEKPVASKAEEKPVASKAEEKLAPPVSSSSITTGQKNALSKAKSYLNVMPLSHQGLIEQLEFEKFSYEDAVYGADNCNADWNEQAAKKGKSYLGIMSFSLEGLIDQLVFDGFTIEQATHGAKANGY